MVSSRPLPDRDALRLWRRALDVRFLTLTVVALASPWMPTLRQDGWVAPAALLGIVVPYSALLSYRVRRTGTLDPWLPVTDVALAILFAALVPDSWAAVLGVCVADVAFAAVLFGRRSALAASSVGTVGIAITGRNVENGLDVGVIGFVTACVIVIVTVGMVSTRERELRQRYTGLVHGVDGIVWEYDLVGRRMTFVSPQVETILGWAEADALDGAVWRARTHPDDVRWMHLDERARAADGGQLVELRVRHADGHWVWLRDSLTVARDEGGEPVALRGIAVDVTAQREAAVALQQYGDIVERVELALVVWRQEDPDDVESIVVVRRNPAAATFFDDFTEVGDRLVDVVPVGELEHYRSLLLDTIRTGRDHHLAAVPHIGRDGRTAYFAMRIFPLPDRCAGVMAEDVTGAHLAEEQLRRRALHDSLTGLPNRALLQDRVATALAAARRTGTPVALLMMDLDQFKEINDTLGHSTGDRLLQEVARRLEHLLRDCDTVARLGGDEFAVLITTDAEGAERVAERIVTTIAEPFDLGAVRVQTGVSIGIARAPEHGADPDTLTQRADVAMYAAKRAGRGFATYAVEEDRSSVRRLALGTDLRDAVDRAELVLHYQPQLDISSGRVVGVEALLRWQHPRFGLLLPSEFIELAEVTGSIRPLTQWVIREAVTEASRLRDAGHDLVMAVNVSGRNLYEAELVGDIAEQLVRSRVRPDHLLLELTESQLVDDPSQVMTVLTLASEMGVRLAIDDFGTGWSSLANLTRLPIDQIKIDRSFVSRMLHGGDDAVVVRSILDLGHNLGLTVVAEGVEDEPTLQALADLGCDQAQGYHLARPVPAADLRTWLDAHRATPVG